MKKSISRIIAFILAIVFSVTFISSETENLITVDSTSASYTVSIEADYATNTLTAVVTDENGDVIADEISYAWYQSEDAKEFSVVDDANTNTLTFEDTYSYYVVAKVNDQDYTSKTKLISTAIADVKIQNDIYRDDVLTALLLNSDGDVLYYSDGGSDMTTYNSDATYTWYRSDATYDNTTTNVTPYAGATIYTNIGAEESGTTYEEMTGEDFTEAREQNTLEPITTGIGGGSYYYYVVVTIDGVEHKASPRIANIYTGITVEIEQVKADDSNDITLNMVVYDDNGDVMLNEDGSYYYNSAYTTTWYKSKEYFASTGNGTTADENSAVTTSATIPLGYAPQDYYTNSNYMRVSNAVYNASTNIYGYTNSITVSGEVGRYYYVDINKNKANGSAEAGADPVFVRNCTSTVVVEDHIATDGTFKAVVYDAYGNQVTKTDSYTYTWYKTVSGTTNYVNDKDNVKTSNSGTFVSTYSSDNGTSYTTSAYYSDSGKFMRNRSSTYKTSEYDGTLMNTENSGISYGLVRENFSEELQAVSDVFADANYQFNTNTNSTEKFETTDGSSSLNDGSTCNIAKDEGQLRYYYVTVADGNTTYTSAVKYVKYSNQIENGGFQDYANQSSSSSALEASIMPYWETTNKGYSESYSTTRKSNEQYYRMHPLLEIGNYLGGTSYGTYGNYYSYPGLTYDKDDSTKIQTSTLDDYYEMGYDDDSTNKYVYSDNQFCEINSTDSNTLYQTVMTIPDMPLYWSLTHHARTSAGKSTNITNSVVYKDDDDGDVKVTDLGATNASVQVAIDVMYVVIMNETDAEDLLSNGADQAAQQDIIDAMVLYITTNNAAQVIQNSEDGSSYLARYDGSYTYGGTEYDDISVWRVQTGSTKVTLTFGTDETAKENAQAAAKNEKLLTYYAEKYGTVKSYSYSSTSSGVTTYYAAFYTEAETYSDTYVIPGGQYVSRYFFVAGNSANTKDANGNNAYTDTSELSFGTYTDDNGEEQTISDYNDVKRATNTSSNGNFIDNVVFSQQLDVTVNYWLYQSVDVTTIDENGNEVTTTEWKYVLQSADTEESKAMSGNTVTAGADTVAEYYSKYKFVGSYVSADGGKEDTPTSVDEDGNSVLGTATSFKADADDALVMDLYYKPYTIEFTKKISGLPDTMSYADFEDKLTVYIYSLTTDETTGEYKKSETLTFSEKLKYSSTTNEDGTTTLSLTLSTDAILEKGTYLISESTEILLTDDFDGWFSVGMAVSLGALEYDEDLGGFILVVDEDENGIDSDSAESKDAIIEIEISNSYKPVSVDCEKSVIFGSTDVKEINEGLTGEENTTSEKLNYKSLTEYDEENSVDDTDLDDKDRLAVLSGDTLTYRMVLTSTGNSNNVKVVDSVPEGCTLVNGSIKILYQKRSEKQGSHYGIVQEILDSSGNSTSGTWTLYDTDETTELYKITYDSDKEEITWNISEIGFYEVYYVEYEVTVDQIKASSASELLTNDADWSYHSGFISDSTNASNSTSTGVEMNMTTETTNDTISYTVTYSGLSNYTVTWLKDTLPDGFTIEESTIKINALDDTDYTVTYYDSDGKELTGTYDSEDIATILITFNKIESSDGGKLTLTFEGTQSDVDDVDDVRNTAGIKFTQSNDNTVYSAVVSYGEGTTNQVETDVTHLYLNIEKQIESEDPYQTFIFKVEYYKEGNATATPDGISYVNINCTEYDSTDDYYYGSRFIQTDRRGTYVITEVTDWSYTDYDESVEASGENAEAPYDESYSISEKDGTVTVVLLTDSEDKNAAFLTKLGSLKDGTYTTSVFKNTDSEYAYRSGQAYTVNIMQ